MEFRNLIIAAGLAAATALMGACASPPATNATPTAAPAPAPVPTAAAAEADTAAGLEKRFQEAARSYKIVQKEGKTLYCKREKVMGSTIPTLQCITEAQLRIQVENTDEMRQRMRNKAGGCMPSCAGGG